MERGMVVQDHLEFHHRTVQVDATDVGIHAHVEFVMTGQQHTVVGRDRCVGLCKCGELPVRVQVAGRGGVFLGRYQLFLNGQDALPDTLPFRLVDVGVGVYLVIPHFQIDEIDPIAIRRLDVLRLLVGGNIAPGAGILFINLVNHCPVLIGHDHEDVMEDFSILRIGVGVGLGPGCLHSRADLERQRTVFLFVPDAG